MKRPAKHIVIRILVPASLFGSAVHFLPVRYHLQEVSINASFYHLIISLILLVCLFICKDVFSARYQWGLKIILGFLCLNYLLPLKPFYSYRAQSAARPPADQGKRAANVRLFYANVHEANQNYSQLRSLILAARPNIVGLLEVNEAWERGLDLAGLFKTHHYVPFADCYGLVLYSDYPVAGNIEDRIGDHFPPVIRADLQVTPGRTLSFTLLHAQPPKEDRALETNKVLFRRVLTPIRHAPGDVLVAGDFNATPYSGYYRRFIWGARLDNAMHGFGLWRSWKADSWFLRFTIDHVLYRGRLKVLSFEVLPDVGSDHLPYLVDFELE